MWKGCNTKLYKHNQVLKIKLLVQQDIHPKNVDSSKLDVLAEIAINFKRSKEISKSNVVINQILDGIITNTLSISCMQINKVNQKGKEYLYDLGIIYRDQHKLKIQTLQEIWFSQYMQVESKWKKKFLQLKTQRTIDHTNP